MLKPREFVFIILKPAAAKNMNLTNFIKKELLKYGDIKYIKKVSSVNPITISEHYKDSKSSFWYPLLISYFKNKSIICFILESKNEDFILTAQSEDSFAKFLKQEVIGSANIFKAKKNHIRRLALKNFSSCFLDNLIHCSDNTKSALEEIRIWYKDNPMVIEEFETKASSLIKVKKDAEYEFQ